MVSIRRKHLDGILVIRIVRFWLQCTNKLSKIIVYAITMSDTSNIELDHFELIIILGPYGDMVAMINETEVFEHLHLCFFIFLFWKRVAVLVQ